MTRDSALMYCRHALDEILRQCRKHPSIVPELANMFWDRDDADQAADTLRERAVDSGLMQGSTFDLISGIRLPDVRVNVQASPLDRTGDWVFQVTPGPSNDDHFGPPAVNEDKSS